MKKVLRLSVVRFIVKTIHRASINLLRRAHPEWDSRRWSNQQLERYGKLFKGSILNVSGWKDEDKEGRKYADYFPNKENYLISNISGARGASGINNEIILNLENDLDQSLQQSFDVVFNHTTLEHVFSIEKAFKNICDLSRDIVIVIVPFMQIEHFEHGSYLDYWRFTRFSLQEMFRKNNYKLLYLSSNYNPVFPVYYFCIATRNPEKWGDTFGSITNYSLDTENKKCNPLDENLKLMR